MDPRQRNSIIRHFALICHSVPMERLKETFADIFNQEHRRYFALLQSDYLRNEMMVNIIMQAEQENLFQRFCDFLWDIQVNEGNIGALVADSYKVELAQAIDNNQRALDSRYRSGPVYRSVMEMCDIISTLKNKGNKTNDDHVDVTCNHFPPVIK